MLNLDKFNAHSGLSAENFAKTLQNPVLWSSKIDPIGYEYRSLKAKFNAQTMECPEGVDGNTMFHILNGFVKWLTWHIAFPGVACDRQCLLDFECTSGLDRSVAHAIINAGAIFGI